MASVIPVNRQNYSVQIVSPIGRTIFVGASAIVAAAADPGRSGIIFANPGDETLWLMPGTSTAVEGRGIPLLPGAVLRFLGDRLVNYTCAWSVIAASNLITDQNNAPITDQSGDPLTDQTAGGNNNNPLTIIDMTSSNPLEPLPSWITDQNNDPITDQSGDPLTE